MTQAGSAADTEPAHQLLPHQVKGQRQIAPPPIETRSLGNMREELRIGVPMPHHFSFDIPPARFAHQNHGQQLAIAAQRRRAGTPQVGRPRVHISLTSTYVYKQNVSKSGIMGGVLSVLLVVQPAQHTPEDSLLVNSN